MWCGIDSHIIRKCYSTPIFLFAPFIFLHSSHQYCCNSCKCCCNIYQGLKNYYGIAQSPNLLFSSSLLLSLLFCLLAFGPLGQDNDGIPHTFLYPFHLKSGWAHVIVCYASVSTMHWIDGRLLMIVII